MSEACAEKFTEKTMATVAEVAALIRQNDRFLIVSHMRPDGDCIGSTMGLLLGLRALGKTVAAYNHTGLTDKWAFVPGWQEMSQLMPSWEPAVTIFVDCGGISRVSDDFEPVGLTINIDHHLTNDKFGDYNYIDLAACAVGEQVYDLLRELDVTLTTDMASSIYLSIMSDTGSFKFSNTNARAFHIAGEMAALGANPGEVCTAVYESKTKGEMALIAKVYGSLNYEFDDVLVWSQITLEDYAACGGPESEPEGLVSDIRAVKGVEVSLLMHEMPGGTGIRAGWRGKGRIDCSAIAESCGGGGHFNAAGTTIKDMGFDEGREYVLRLTREAITRWLREMDR